MVVVQVWEQPYAGRVFRFERYAALRDGRECVVKVEHVASKLPLLPREVQ